VFPLELCAAGALRESFCDVLVVLDPHLQELIDLVVARILSPVEDVERSVVLDLVDSVEVIETAKTVDVVDDSVHLIAIAEVLDGLHVRTSVDEQADRAEEVASVDEAGCDLVLVAESDAVGELLDRSEAVEDFVSFRVEILVDVLENFDQVHLGTAFAADVFELELVRDVIS
jgi:hypothetical protein